ncbi:MAG: FAD-linked oxidase C-terminal domain-containing protein [Armatimonadota bacterium]|nr:FAD-linked oxidase C-terminal domain-containing protein [Armatimonadota bacterium]
MRESILRKLQEISGSKYVLTAPEDLVCYGYDAQHVEHCPEAIVRAGSAEEVCAILHLANEEGLHVTPRGAGTGLSGGSVPAAGGLVLDLGRMNRIIEIDQSNLLATVEPGVITADLASAVEAVGLMYPPDPGSIKVSTLGGNVAENAGGLRAIKYGVTADYIKVIEGATPTGEFFKAGAVTMKSVAGYDLVHLLCGSEGTLAVFTKLTFKLLPLPKARRSMVGLFSQLTQAAETVSAIISAGIMPATLEIMDNVTIRTVEEFKKIGLPIDAGAMLLLEVDGASAQVAEEADKAASIMTSHNASEVQVASTHAERDRVWEARRSALAALARVRPTAILEDATVPRSQLADMVSEINRIADKYSLTIGTFGHAGDGNLHPTILTDQRDKEEMARVEKAIEEIFNAALQLGGTVSGEHGIGFAKSRYLAREVGPGTLGMMRTIKSALDPKGILNPGKIFTDQTT